MSSSTHPQVHWSQRHEHVTLVADVFDLKEYSVEVKNDSKVVAFSASDKADKQYVFELELYGAVSADKIKKSSTGRQVVIQLDKLEQVWWPRLTKAASKTAWVKTDFARWKDEDESESENEGGQGMDFGSMGAGGAPFNFGGAGGGMPASMDWGDDSDEEYEEEGDHDNAAEHADDDEQVASGSDKVDNVNVD